MLLRGFPAGTPRTGGAAPIDSHGQNQSSKPKTLLAHPGRLRRGLQLREVGGHVRVFAFSISSVEPGAGEEEK